MRYARYEANGEPTGSSHLPQGCLNLIILLYGHLGDQSENLEGVGYAPYFGIKISRDAQHLSAPEEYLYRGYGLQAQSLEAQEDTAMCNPGGASDINCDVH